MARYEVTEELIACAAARVVELGWCEPGMRVGITAGLPSGRPGSTSLMQVQELPAPGRTWAPSREIRG
jgi:pyruvate kinase